MQDDSYLVMRRSEKQFVIEATMGGEHGLQLAQEYCRRKNWQSPDGAELVIYQLVEIVVDK